MECHGYDMILVALGLITGISEVLALLNHVECNGILDFIIRLLITRRQCADADTVEIPNVSTHHTELRIRRSFEQPNVSATERIRRSFENAD